MNDADLGQQILLAWRDRAPNAAFHIDGIGPHGAAIEHRAAEQLEVGSCFKTFVAAECCRRVAAGALRWNEPLTLAPDLRVPDSAAFGDLPDGATVTLREAAEAMIAVSDNTATDLLLRRVGPAAVRALVAEAGLTATRLPESVRSVYDAAAADPNRRVVACLSTMRDLTRFYTWVLTGGLAADPTALDAFAAIMRHEDLAQGTPWADGVVCYRKSGFLEPPPLLAVAMAGAFVAPGRTVPFAFAYNVELADPTTVPPTVEAITLGVSQGMRGIVARLVAHAG